MLVVAVVVEAVGAAAVFVSIAGRLLGQKGVDLVEQPVYHWDIVVVVPVGFVVVQRGHFPADS